MAVDTRLPLSHLLAMAISLAVSLERDCRPLPPAWRSADIVLPGSKHFQPGRSSQTGCRPALPAWRVVPLWV